MRSGGLLERLRFSIWSLRESLRFMPDVSPETHEIITRVLPFTVTRSLRVAALCDAVEFVVRNRIPGDFVECGVYKGGSTMAAALTFKRLGDTPRTLHLFDTFEGMVAPTAADRKVGTGALASELLQADSHFKMISPLSEVERNMATTGYPAERIRYIKGKVEDTLLQSAPASIAILRLDTDWYESTRHELVHLYPRLSVGGVLIVDDYGYWEGARKAVDEYFASLSNPPLLCRIDYSSRIAIKR